MSTIKVLHVIARMNVGGTARYVQTLVENIPNSKIATGFVQGSETEDQTTEKLPIFRIKHLGRRVSLVNDYQSFKELRRYIRAEKPLIVHTHTFKAGLIGRLVGGSHKRIHTFHGHLYHDNSFSRLEKMLITLTERILAKRTDALISVGSRVGRELRTKKIGKEKIWLSIAPGVKRYPTISKQNARKQLGLSESGLIVGWMARMTSVKNPQLFIDVARRMPDVQFAMAGGGELLDLMRAQAPANLKVVGWTNAALFLSAIDISISTSNNEGMPIALIEAQQAGIPVLATNVGSNSEVIISGETGFIIKKDADTIAEVLHKLIFLPQLVKTLGKNAKAWANKEFSPDKMIQSHVKLYENILN